MFCLVISVKHFSVLLKALEKHLKSGVYQLEIKNLKSEYSVSKQLRTPCNMGLPFFFGHITSLFFNLKTKSSKGPQYKNTGSLHTEQGEHVSDKRQMPALSLASQGGCDLPRLTSSLLPPSIIMGWASLKLLRN